MKNGKILAPLSISIIIIILLQIALGVGNGILDIWFLIFFQEIGTLLFGNWRQA